MDWTSIIIATIPVVGAILTTIITSKMTRKEVKKIGVAQLDLMRNEITKIYYKRQVCKKLYQYERESLDRLYEGYHAGGGNTFIDDIYAEMRHWLVVPAGQTINEGE